MNQPDALAKTCYRQHLTAVLKAANAKRLLRKGHTEDYAARRAGYKSIDAMRKAIRKYAKSPAPTGIGNEADQNIHQQNSTIKEARQ